MSKKKHLCMRESTFRKCYLADLGEFSSLQRVHHLLNTELL